MQKMMVDTNVLVSTLINNGYPHLVIQEALINKHIELCLSNDLLKEYYEVLNRNKFSGYQNFATNAHMLLVDIKMIGHTYDPKVSYDIMGDQDDNKLLELAETCKADFLITGNLNDFTMSSFKETKIVTPKNYWTTYKIK
jgi:putative PIN family toxin of toxin-antitoxin system